MKQKEQTAVEWLATQIMDNWNDITAGTRNIAEFIEQAKQMEKEQVESAYYTGATNFSEHSTKAVRWSKQYYNEEYGKNNQSI